VSSDIERFNQRLDELFAERWLLPEDAEEMRAEAEQADVP
jgi:glutathione S-transferase